MTGPISTPSQASQAQSASTKLPATSGTRAEP